MKLFKRFQVKPGDKINLAEWDPNDNGGLNKQDARATLQSLHERLFQLQQMLHADAGHALLIVLQAMDTGGKDGTIRRVMGGLNPQGCRVSSFKVPSEEELAHDFLWRVHLATPKRGEIGIFNRSHYGDVLVVRVHNLIPKQVWSRRYDQINAFEKLLSENHVHIRKFYLHISKDEQKERLQERIDDPTKHWKVSAGDFEERKFWDDYTAAYEAALTKCSTEWAPWYIVPANRKWFRDLVVAEAIVDALESMRLEYPKTKIDLSKLVME